MIALVTGGAGFIGSSLVLALLQRGDTVRVLDNFSTGKRENLDGLDVHLVEGDVRSYHLVQRAVDGVEVVFHQAALPSVPRSIADPITSHEVNAGGTLNVLSAARHAGARRVVYASSSSVYGNGPGLPKHEGMRTDPLSPYAVSKLAGETYARVFSGIYGMETVALRYFNVFGPRQDPASQYAAVIPRFVQSLLHGQRPTVFGDGEQSRDFTYIDNVVQANLLAADAPGASGLAINCACGREASLNDLVREIGRCLGVETDPLYAEPRAGDVRASRASIDLATETLGYRPSVHFAEGLARTVDALAPHRPAQSPSA